MNDSFLSGNEGVGDSNTSPFRFQMKQKATFEKI